MCTDKLHLISFSKESRCRRLYAVHNLQLCNEINVTDLYLSHYVVSYTIPVPYSINNRTKYEVIFPEIYFLRIFCHVTPAGLKIHYAILII